MIFDENKKFGVILWKRMDSVTKMFFGAPQKLKRSIKTNEKSNNNGWCVKINEWNQCDNIYIHVYTFLHLKVYRQHSKTNDSLTSRSMKHETITTLNECKKMYL